MNMQTGNNPPGGKAPAELVPFPAQPSAQAPKRPHRRGWIFGSLAVLLLLAGSAAAWFTLRGGAPVHYVTAPATVGSVTRSVSATGTVNPELTIIVGSYVSGVIQDVSCDYNTEVKKGQVCARIDPRPYQTAVDQAKANLDVAKAQLEKDRASQAYAKRAFERAAELVKTSAVSKDSYDNAKSAYDQAAAQVALDQASIEQRQAALNAAQVNLGYTNIVSPVDGTVVSRNVTIGQTVAASFQTPTLFLIATDLTKMEVDTNVSESDIGGIKQGDKASFTVDAFPRRTFQGTVLQVRQSPQTVQNVVTYDVVIGVANPDLALKPGLTASAAIVTDQRTNVLRVPNAALRFAPGGIAAIGRRGQQSATGRRSAQARVWLLSNGKPVSVQVTTGLNDDTYTEIAGGNLKQGDQVIVSEQGGSVSAAAQANAPRLRF